MAHGEHPPRVVGHVFTRADRAAQLSTLHELCHRIAQLLVDHGEPWQAQQFAERAEFAQRLFSTGFARDDVNELAAQFPVGPWWLNPKALDFDAPREPWQEEVARLHAVAADTARDLRAVAALAGA